MTLLILPDSDNTRSVELSRLELDNAQVKLHPSGRPWIIGDWSAEDLVEAELTDARICLFGPTTTSKEQLKRMFRSVTSTADIDTLARRIDGSVLLASSIGGTLRVQGPVSTASKFFFLTEGKTAVVSDRAHVLSQLSTGEINEANLALALLSPYGAPWPLSEETLWKGVVSVPGGYALTIQANGSRSIDRWWHPPGPEFSLEQGAARVAHAIETAVSARTEGSQRPVCADFSGGMDSTTLAFFAADQAASLVTVHNEPLGDANDDTSWAERCALELPNATHVKIARGSGPHLYSNLNVDGVDLDGPSPFARARDTYDYLAQITARAGAKYHLGGVGADELFQPTVLTIAALAQTDLKKTLPHVRRFRHRYRWNLRETRTIFSKIPRFHRWLASSSDMLESPRTWSSAPDIDWEVGPRMPPWATSQAVEEVRQRIINSASAQPEPLSPLPVDHSIIRLMQVNGTAMRFNNKIAARHGVRLEAPFADDRVIEAALSVRLEARLADGRPKAVLERATRGRVPYVFDRTMKGDYSAEVYDGLKQGRPALDELCDDLALGKAGLVSALTLRRIITGLHPDVRPLTPLDSTIGLELWLRAAKKSRSDSLSAAPRQQNSALTQKIKQIWEARL